VDQDDRGTGGAKGVGQPYGIGDHLGGRARLGVEGDDAPLQVDQDECGLTGVKLGDRHGSLLQVVDRR